LRPRSCILAGMHWTERLAEPVVLDNGEVLYTLFDAREFLLALPEQDLRHPKWQRLIGSLLGAAHTGRADVITIATNQLRQALLTPPFAHARLVDDTPKKPPAPSAKHRLTRGRRAKLLK
jgi:hypothetical protein